MNGHRTSEQFTPAFLQLHYYYRSQYFLYEQEINVCRFCGAGARTQPVSTDPYDKLVGHGSIFGNIFLIGNNNDKKYKTSFL